MPGVIGKRNLGRRAFFAFTGRFLLLYGFKRGASAIVLWVLTVVSFAFSYIVKRGCEDSAQTDRQMKWPQ